MISFTVIKTVKDGMFIKDDSAYGSNIPNYFFDGEKLIKTPKDKWYKLDKMPTKVQKKGSDTYTNRRYELKAGYPVSELTPQIIAYDDFDTDDEISGLYKSEFDVVDGILEDVEFEIEVLSEEENFYVEKPKFQSTPLLITELTTHPDLLHNRPCKIGSEALYKVVREHIKQNYDGRYARISSDYDFCLTVQKLIGIEPEPYYTTGGTKRKPTQILQYRKQRTLTVFECAPKSYQSYTVLQPIVAKNQSELDDKVQKYLDEIIEKINKPFVDCECCKGMGVILKED